jgi:hypothetical protein
VLKIRDWKRHFENNRTRELKRMDWVPIPNRMDGAGYLELLDHVNGPTHFAAWIAILEIASRQDDRGVIPQKGAELTRRLARISRMPAVIFDEALPRLAQLGWIDIDTVPQDGAVSQIPQDPAVPSRDTRAVTERKGREGNGTERNGSAAAEEQTAPSQAHPPQPKKPSSFPSPQIPKAVQNALLTTERIDWMRDALQGYMQRDGSQFPVKPPDDEIILRCLNAVGDTDLETIGETLRTLRVNGQAPGRPGGPEAYSWFPKVLHNIFQADASQ